MYLNKRIENILEILIKSDYITAQKIAKTFDISKRTAYYDLEKAQNYLNKNNIELKSERHLGYYLSPNDKENVSKLLKYSSKDYILSSKERYIKILINLLICNEKITIEKLCDMLAVSRNTVLTDIKDSRKYITRYNLKIEFQNGYKIQGKECNKRYLFINLHNQYSYLFVKYDFLDEYSLLKEQWKCENKHSLKFNEIDYALRYLLNFYKNSYKVGSSISYSKEDMVFLDSLDSNYEAKNILENIKTILKKNIVDSEVYYIQLILTKDDEIREFLLDQDIKSKYISSIRMTIKEFENIACISIEDNEELLKNIFNHLMPSLFKLKYGIYYPNYIKDEVKNKYKSIFQFTKQVVKNIENTLDIFLNDDELAYIAMYFGGYTAKIGVRIKIPKIVIVCNSGMATSHLLKRQIEELFDLVEIIHVLSLEQFKKFDKHYDFAITTVDLDINKENVIKVNTILTNLDKQKLMSQISNTQSEFNLEQQLLKKIMKSIEKYTKVINRESLKEEIEDILISRKEKIDIYKATLGELLNKDTITLNEYAKDWKEAIRISSKKLLDLGFINESYINSMIKNIETLGPYIIISKDVALPHSKPDDGVNKLGISITTFKEDIVFSNNERHKARVFITLAPKDKQSHLNALASINNMLSDKHNVEKIISASCEEEILDLVKNYS
jgi:transcriptional antiterminator